MAITAEFWIYVHVTAEQRKTANRRKIAVIWQYRPACVRLKTVTDNLINAYSYPVNTTRYSGVIINTIHIN